MTHPPSVVTESADAPPETEALSRDELVHLLRNRRRRDVLRYLKGREGPVRMRDVAERIAAREHDTTVDDLESSERRRVYVSLYRSHLPKLDEAGVVDYRRDRGLVERRPLADRLDAYLEDERIVDVDRGHNAAALTGIGVLFLAGALLELSGAAMLSDVSPFVAVLLVVAVLTVEHVNRYRSRLAEPR